MRQFIPRVVVAYYLAMYVRCSLFLWQWFGR
jgi:hypothetical protein